ncbi:HNH endonuclease [Sinorhizobium meliloti]|uniref:HNH endonuclease n=1 Tax=Rhizobium meliloti TaxID=382 RepID=UPI000FDB978C|nr:HNH endonuclease [Sinorhizobium meliloti]RVN04088.1 pathogenesis-related transcriptional factor and ERF protein [Sinorhizobium meliloti]
MDERRRRRDIRDGASSKREFATAQYLNECFEYNESTGSLVWRTRPRHHFKNNQAFSRWNNKFPGGQAGTAEERGYIILSLNGVILYAHRIIWAIIQGINLCDVPDEIDHKDLDKSNNRKNNLREAERWQNGSNRALQCNNTSGHKGVDWHKQGKSWRVRINVSGKEIQLGLYKNFDDAVAARLAANDMHGEFARVA